MVPEAIFLLKSSGKALLDDTSSKFNRETYGPWPNRHFQKMQNYTLCRKNHETRNGF